MSWMRLDFQCNNRMYMYQYLINGININKTWMQSNNIYTDISLQLHALSIVSRANHLSTQSAYNIIVN